MKKKHLKELERIQDSVPDSIKGRLLRKKKVTPTVRKVVDLALNDPEISDKKKEQLRNLNDTGLFDKSEEVVNKTAQKELDEYMNTQIARSIAAGRLPKPKNNTVFDKYIAKCKKNM